MTYQLGPIKILLSKKTLNAKLFVSFKQKNLKKKIRPSWYATITLLTCPPYVRSSHVRLEEGFRLLPCILPSPPPLIDPTFTWHFWAGLLFGCFYSFLVVAVTKSTFLVVAGLFFNNLIVFLAFRLISNVNVSNAAC